MRKTVMVIDDDEGLLSLLELMLRRGGFEVQKASEAQRALELSEQTTPDLFILDVMMPGMTGIELCTHLRARPETAHSPILMLSAYGDDQTIGEAMTAGASDYLVKPVQHVQLLAKVSLLLGEASTAA